MNTNSAVEGPRARIFHSMYRTVDAVFPHTYVFVLGREAGQPQISRNIILVATNGGEQLDRDRWVALARDYESASYVDGKRMQQMVTDLLTDVPDVAAAPIFTDDYAPIETMPF